MSQTSQLSPPNFAVDQGLEYYAGKSELLDWVNRLLDLNLVRLEQLTSGAVYCQVLDAFYADAVTIRKVNFLAREEYEIIPNYKVLQAAFNALGFTKELNVPKLSQASTSDLMEFAQWLYKSFKGVATLPGYNPAARRELSKYPTNSIPFPACCMNGNFDFGRSDLRVSGLWAATTPQEPTKTLPRTQRPTSSTPATGSKPGTAEKGSGGSSVKRTMPNLNVTSRYREGLAVPPEHYQRSSPLLSPKSPGPPLPPVPVRDGGTQTDFVDEEYRPMTEEDVGTETVPPRTALRDQGEQYGDGFGYGSSSRSGANGDMLNTSGSAVSAADSAKEHPGGQQDDTFTFGQASPAQAAHGALGRLAGDAALPLVHAQAAPAPGSDSGNGDGGMRRDSSGAAEAGTQYTSTRDASTGLDSDEERRAANCDAASGSSGAAASPRQDSEVQANGTADVAELASAHEDDGFSGFATPAAAKTAPAPFASPSLPHGDQTGSQAAQDDGRQTSPTVTADSLGGPEPGLASPTQAGPSPGTGAAPGTPSTPAALAAGLRRSAAGSLPVDVASLLASPGPRHRVASAVGQRNMAMALEVAAASLAAVHKGLDSYTTLLSSVDGAVVGGGSGGDAPGAAPAGQGSSAAGPAAEGSDGAVGTSGFGTPGGPPPVRSCSAALCGKARSLQDALQTVLTHTALLLADAYAYSEATQPQPATPSSRLASSRFGSPAASRGGASPPGGEAAGSTASPVSVGEGGQRNYMAEAAALLELASSHERRLQSLMQQASGTLQLPSGTAEPDRGEPAGSAASGSAAAGSVSASAAAVSANTSHQHLTADQRRLCSTASLDSHLKAVGAAQFALVQGIHKELVELTTAYFRHAGSAVETSAGGDAGGSGGGAAAVNRKARVFKLGEFQLKQLRNGDVYKGRYISNKKNGEGVYHFINADVYEGEFRDDRMDGYGVYTFSHEGRFEGQWRNAVYNGTGAETFAKGSTYRGEYASGLRNGWGACRFYNGDYYEGQWAKGQRDGSGMQQCTDDSNFVGDYHRGKRHGHGVYSFPNGDRYEGQYYEDLPHGHGTYYFASGQCYQGQWQQGKKHGWSVYTVDNGSRFMGLWSQGKPTWVQPLNGDAAAAATASDDDERSLQQALEARDLAVKAAAEARQRAARHWDAAGAIQANVQSALSRAHTSAALAQAARRKACDLAAKLDAAVALLQTQGGAAAHPSAATNTP